VEVLGDALCGVELGVVALVVVDGEGVAGESAVGGDGECCGAVESAGEEDDGWAGLWLVILVHGRWGRW